MGNQQSSGAALQDRVNRAHRTGILTLCSLGLQELPRQVSAELSDPVSTLAPLIKSLDLSRNKLFSLPPEISVLGQLKILNLAHNKLQHIGVDCRLCERLEVNHWLISNYYIFFSIHYISSTTQILDLRGNGLASLQPALLANLTNLRSLHLSNNQITQLPAALFQLQALVVLDISHNRLCFLNGVPAAAAQDMPQWTRLGKLEQLNAEYNQLEVIPVELVDMASLTKLNLSHNRLQTVPQQLFANKRLKTITIDGNPLSQSKFMNIDGYKEYEQRHKDRADQLLKLND